ncbi:hypothetical protein HanRHA438_Chr07g0323091 [Helianthus annuus]|nr:hypothetical protein HanRHA438_Chr07g0323091 [Helianthus annuus]
MSYELVFGSIAARFSVRLMNDHYEFVLVVDLFWYDLWLRVMTRGPRGRTARLSYVDR